MRVSLDHNLDLLIQYLVAVCCLIIIASSLYNSTQWREKQAALKTLSASSIVTSQPRPPENSSAIFDFHAFTERKWFGSIEVETATAEINIDALPESSLNINLIGCYTNDIADKSEALVAINRERPKWLKVGQSIAPSTILHAVHRHSIVLMRDQELEVIHMGTRLMPSTPQSPPSNQIRSPSIATTAPTGRSLQRGKAESLTNQNIQFLLVSRLSKRGSQE